MQELIKRAKELLADQEKKISEIATLVGYSKPSNFAAAFKKKYLGKVPAGFFQRMFPPIPHKLPTAANAAKGGECR